MLTSLYDIFGHIVAATQIIVVLDNRQKYEHMNNCKQGEVWPDG